MIGKNDYFCKRIKGDVNMKSTKNNSNSSKKIADAAKVIRILKLRQLTEQLPKNPSKT